MIILLATHNPAKIKRYRALLGDLPGLELKTLADLAITARPDEPFATAEANAIHKAKEYARLSGLPTLAIDEAVTTNFLPDNEQPGVMVRRLTGGRELTDQEVLAAWQEILARYPGEGREVVWEYWLAFADPDRPDIRTARVFKPSRVTDIFSPVVNAGYPMSSFLIAPGYDRPFSELSEAEKLASDRRTLKPFREFVERILASY